MLDTPLWGFGHHSDYNAKVKTQNFLETPGYFAIPSKRTDICLEGSVSFSLVGFKANYHKLLLDIWELGQNSTRNWTAGFSDCFHLGFNLGYPFLTHIFVYSPGCLSKWPWVKLPIVPPVSVPIPTKMGSRMGGAPTPKWDPKTVLTTTAK